MTDKERCREIAYVHELYDDKIGRISMIIKGL